MKTNNRTAAAYASLMVVFFCWGSVYVSNRYVLEVLETMELACCRFLISSVSLGVFIRLRGIRIRVEREDWKYMIFIGFMAYYVSMMCTLLSVQYAGASLASLINSLNPVFITIFAVFFLKEKLTGTKVVCLALGLVGVFIVSGGDTAGGEIIGVVYGIGSIVTWAWSSMYIRRLSDRYDAMVITFIAITISLVFHIPTAAVTMARCGVPEVSPLVVACIFYSGLCGTAIPQFLWNFSLSRLEASTCAMFYPLMPIWSALLGVALLGESITLRFLLGGALIISTVVVNALGGRLQGLRFCHRKA